MLRKHPASSDIAMEVLKSYYVKEKDLYKVKVRWWNIGKCHEPWCIHEIEKLEIPAAKFREWKRM